jgi:hypothetical protein
MKTQLKFLGLFLMSLFLLPGCLDDKCQEEVTYYNAHPVYKTLEEIRVGIENEAPRELEKPGKIYFYEDFVLINEQYQGLHIIDNSSPENPQNLGFLNIPGNIDMAVQNGILYANNYIDLLAIDISDPLDAKLESRTEYMFPPIWEEEATGRLLTHYEYEKVVEIRDCEDPLIRDGQVLFDNNFNPMLSNAEFALAADQSSNSTGTGGSMARFTITANHLYTIDQSNMKVFSLQNALEPDLANEVLIGWGIETIFPYEDKLFIGSNSGMFIYDNSNPTNPTELSRLAHATACDPVFVKDNYAYVTLRGGSICQNFNNQLDLVDITDIRNPVLEKTFKMSNPHGLSISDNTLFICEGDYGLRAFDIEDPLKLNRNELDYIHDIHAYDVIVIPNKKDVAMVIGEDGFFQYDFTDPKKLKLLSTINVSK